MIPCKCDGYLSGSSGKVEIVVKSVPHVVETSDRAPTTLLTPLTVDTTYAHFSLWMYPRAVDRQTKTLSNIPPFVT